MGPLPDLADSEGIVGKFLNPSIRNLKEGAPILVQVTKEPMGAKGARLSTQISLQGSYVIYLALMGHKDVSRKISGVERGCLKEIVRRLKAKVSGGFVIRTVAEGAAEEELAA